MLPASTISPTPILPPRPPLFIVESPVININTLVLLHGTSSYGAVFGQELAEKVDFGKLLPRTKLIFPSGSLRKTTVFDGTVTHAWFDIADFADRTKGEEQQKEGLRESALYLGELIRDVVDSGSHDERFKVFLGGFSQGCALSMVLLLSGELNGLGVLDRLGGFVGLSGWLPFAKQLREIVTPENDWRENRLLVQIWLRRELGLPLPQPRGISSLSEDRMSVLLAHGTSDEKVKLEWGEDMKGVLELVGYEVEWKEYKDMRHIVVPKELVDMTEFIAHMSKTNPEAV